MSQAIPSVAATIGAVLVVLLIGSTGAAGQDRSKEFPGIKALMNDEEFSAAGLEALSPAQLEALDTWLLRYTAGDAEVLQSTNEAVREAEKDYEVVSRIAGEFSGWDGDTVFRLENGQVWRQRLRGSYRYSGPPNPEVRISRNFMGFFKLTLVDEDRGVGVSFVK